MNTAAELLSGELGDRVWRERVRPHLLAHGYPSGIAVDSGGGGEDDAAAPGVARGQQQVERPGDVRGDGCLWVVDRARDGGNGCQVEDDFRALHRIGNRIRVGNVPFEQLDVFAYSLEVLQRCRSKNHPEREPAHHGELIARPGASQ